MQPTIALAVRWLDESLTGTELESAAAWTTSGVLPDVAGAAFLPMLLVWLSGAAALTMWRWVQWHDLSRLRLSAVPLTHGREVSALARLQHTSAPPQPVSLLRCDASCEPAVVGVFRPRLLWPAGLSERLTDAELDAILAHELCHVRRRDNFGALMHVVVEILFWFHPAVWSVGARLAIERERACDEEVLQMGTDARRYAEAILKVCGFSLRGAGAFAAGVGGSDLSRRIERILWRQTIPSIALRARLLLAGALLVAAVTPLGFGVLHAHRPESTNRGGLDFRASGTPHDGRVVYRPGQDVTWPKLVQDVKPAYRGEAIQAGIQGVVMLEAVVLADGTVDGVTVVQSLDSVYGLDDEAVTALEQWTFEPGMKSGEPVAVIVPVEMSFTLK
ncbi:hypothetical protein BH24ACI4_BH24ACI4_27820 [soil metagenome]